MDDASIFPDMPQIETIPIVAPDMATMMNTPAVHMWERDALGNVRLNIDRWITPIYVPEFPLLDRFPRRPASGNVVNQ